MSHHDATPQQHRESATSTVIVTGGGAVFEGGVNVGRDLIGRDQINHYPRSQREELDDYMRRAVAAYEADVYARRHPPMPSEPYKFLYPFTMADQSIFFGRDKAVEELVEKLDHPSRLTVIHAPSGAGKSSLLGAGLMPKLLDQGRLPVYVAVHQDAADPVLAIKKTLTPESNGPWPELLPRISLAAYLGEVLRHMSRRVREIVVLLDQFEAFFVFSPEAIHREPFLNALADCLADASLHMRVVIALRKDYYSDLAYFEGSLPHIFHNQFLLRPMERDSIKSAITGPVERVNPSVQFEEGLLESLLDDLAQLAVLLPHLQIVCMELYENRTSSEGSITLQRYDELGCAAGVLNGYFYRTLDGLSRRRRNIAQKILVALVTSEGTKRSLPYESLIRQFETHIDEAEAVLNYLINGRLVHCDTGEETATCEIAHEYLASEIEKWIDHSAQIVKQAEELLERETLNFSRYGLVIPEDRLEILQPLQKRITRLSKNGRRCLQYSALQAGTLSDWINTRDQIGKDLFLELLEHSDVGIRQTAVEEIGYTGNSDFTQYLLQALDDPSLLVRELAVYAIGETEGKNAVAPMIDILRRLDLSTGVRVVAVEVLRDLEDTNAVPALIQSLLERNDLIQVAAIEALAVIADNRAAEPLVNMLYSKTPAVRRAAAEALSESGIDSTSYLLRALREADWMIQTTIAEVIGRIGDEDAVSSLIETLDCDNQSVREAVLQALTEIHTPEALAAVKRYRQRQPNIH